MRRFGLIGALCGMLVSTGALAQTPDKASDATASEAPTLVIVPPRTTTVPMAPPPAPPLEREGAGAAVPRGTPQNWVTDDDYPAEGNRQLLQGLVGFTLNVDTEGRVDGCTVTRSSGWSALDLQTCWVLRRRARFYPATDESGTAVPGTFSSRMRWQFPDWAKSQRGSWAIIAELSIDEAGKVGGCTIRKFGRTPQGMEMCKGTDSLPRKVISAYRGDAAGRVRILIAWTNRYEDGALPKAYAEPKGEIFAGISGTADVDSEGFLRSCTVTSRSGDEPLGPVPCMPPWNFLPDPGAGAVDRQTNFQFVAVRIGSVPTAK